jgi:hypothetical protein
LASRSWRSRSTCIAEPRPTRRVRTPFQTDATDTAGDGRFCRPSGADSLRGGTFPRARARGYSLSPLRGWAAARRASSASLRPGLLPRSSFASLLHCFSATPRVVRGSPARRLHPCASVSICG